MLEGSCHCGSVKWTFEGMPESATACNCTVCRRYGTLWAYDYLNEGITTSGPTNFYIRGDKDLEFHFCPTCGNLAYWIAAESLIDENGRRRIAVNLRLTEPDPIAHIPIRHFEGLVAYVDLPRDGRTIKDMWF